MKFYVIIPAHNEEKNIGKVIEGVKKHASHIIVVDDGSRDDTAAEAGKLGATVTVLKHAINLGKGAALRTGSNYALSKGAETLVFIDSDGQHDPEDLPKLLTALENSDIAFTFRDKRSENMPLIKKFGNTFIDFATRMLFNIKIEDTQCGYKAMTSRSYEMLKLISNDYSIESEIAAKTGKYRLKFVQIPIGTVYQDRYKGTTVFDGINIVMKLIWWKISR